MTTAPVEFPAVHDDTISAARSIEQAARGLWPSQPVTAGPFTVTPDAGGSATAPVPALSDGGAHGTLELTYGRLLQRYEDDNAITLVFRGNVRVAGKKYVAHSVFVHVGADPATGGLTVETGWPGVVTERRWATAHDRTQEKARELIDAAAKAALSTMTPDDVRVLLRAITQAGKVAAVISSAESTIDALAAVGRGETPSF